jgi:hypothetical protein
VRLEVAVERGGGSSIAKIVGGIRGKCGVVAFVARGLAGGGRAGGAAGHEEIVVGVIEMWATGSHFPPRGAWTMRVASRSRVFRVMWVCLAQDAGAANGSKRTRPPVRF